MRPHAKDTQGLPLFSHQVKNLKDFEGFRSFYPLLIMRPHAEDAYDFLQRLHKLIDVDN